MKKLIVGLITAAVVIGTIVGISYSMRQEIVKVACEELSGRVGDWDSDHCIKGIAVTLRDPNMCELITGSAFAGEFNGQKVQLENPPMMECLTEIAEETNNTALCDKVGGILIAATKIDCLYRVARMNNNSSACNLIGDEEQSRVGVSMNRKACLAQLKFNSNTSGNIAINSESPNMEPPAGECRFDSDCGGICEGNIYWKRGCDAQTNTCKKTFSDDCAEIEDKFGSYTVSQICMPNGCQTDTVAIGNKKKELTDKKQELSDQVKNWLAARQETTELMMTSNKNCLNALAEITNKLIIDSATKLAMLPKTFWDVTSDVTNNLLDQLSSNPKVMSAEEFISLNCNLYKALQTDLDVLEKKIKKAQDEYKDINALYQLLP